MMGTDFSSYAVQKNMGKFQSYFGRSNFLLVDNNSAGEDVFTKVFVEIGKLIDTKPIPT